jgi:hypothetical protein
LNVKHWIVLDKWFNNSNIPPPYRHVNTPPVNYWHNLWHTPTTVGSAPPAAVQRHTPPTHPHRSGEPARRSPGLAWAGRTASSAGSAG